MDVEYPDEKTEIKILMGHLDGSDDALDFATCLVRWANQTRVTYSDGASSDLIPMRRLIHICTVFGVSKNLQ